MSNFYTGSTFLAPITNLTGMKIDQINFVFCQIFACIFGYFFRKYMSPSKMSIFSRHMIEIFIGLFMALFCFGSQTWYLLAQSMPVFISIKFLPIQQARYLVLFFSLAFLSIAHVARMYYDYGSYTLDITGPLMIQTQRLSSLPFNISDGKKLKQNIPLRKPTHKKHAVHRPITILEFLSYMFNFHGLMVGPFVFFVEYIRFIEGKEEESLDDPDEIEYFMKNRDKVLCAKNEINFHIMSLFVFFAMHLFLEPIFRPHIILGEYYNNSNFFIRYILLTLVMFFFRQKYYLAWTTCALTNLFAGIGFSGFKAQPTKLQNLSPSQSHSASLSNPTSLFSLFKSSASSLKITDKNNKNEYVPLYNISKNFHFTETEFGLSAKTMTDHWNVGTAHWLRECVYDRMPSGIGTLAVFACSAIWHGYYPGYYLAFASVALMTTAARICRRIFRPYMIEHNLLQYYHIVTLLCSMFSLNFSILPFALLDLNKGFQVWWSLYMIVPLLCTAIIIFNIFHQKLFKSTKQK